MFSSTELLLLGLLLAVSTIQLSDSVSVNLVHDNVPDSFLDQYDQYDENENNWQKDDMKTSFDQLKENARKINTPLHPLDIQTTTNRLQLGSSTTGKDNVEEKPLPSSSNLKNMQAKNSPPKTTEKMIKPFDHQGAADNYDKITDDENYVDNVSKFPTKKLNKKTKNSSPLTKKSSDEVKPANKVDSKATKVIEITKNGIVSHLFDHKNTESNNIDVGANKYNEDGDEDEDDYDDEDEDEDEDDDDDDDDDDDEDGDDDDDERADFGQDNDIEEEDVLFSQDIPCPRYCVCERNANNYLVAYCSRIDPGTQKFGKDITDLVVTDVSPKYPILLGPHFFTELGLKHVSSIKLANCSIEYLHPQAFSGLDDLYSVNLTNVGLALINPDTFVENKRLRLLTIMGNDLSVMYNLHYIIKSSSIEELNLARNNLQELNPHAFSKLSNILYINLAQNNLQKIPENVFDRLETLEELDLSYNSLKSLPPKVFTNTSLVILNLKGNSISNDLRFGTRMLQRLDLSFNQIHQIHNAMFDKMTGLINLNLKGNDLASIHTDSFISLKDLSHIDLSINKLEQISTMLFYKNSQLEMVYLGDNPRLSQLPTDGFISHNGYFKISKLDINNCAIGGLGHKTFSTMPHLATLKLAWNNINNLDGDTFASLTRLTELDLSNNLIKKLDDDIFKNNNDLIKLNLAGNPLGHLSTRMFKPFKKLRELDVSDCDLSQLLVDSHNKKYPFFDTLRSFNASFNQILRISSYDVRSFKHLRSFDISQNPLLCNAGFQDFISYVSLNSQIFPHKMPTMERIIEENAESIPLQLSAQSGWSALAHEICKHEDDMKRTFNRYATAKDNKHNRLDVVDEVNSYKLSHDQHLPKQKILKNLSQQDKLDKELEEKTIFGDKDSPNIVDVETKTDKSYKTKGTVVRDDDDNSNYDEDESETEEGDDEASENEKSEERDGEDAEEDLGEDDTDEQGHDIEEYAKMIRQLNNLKENGDKFLLDKLLSDRVENYHHTQRLLEERMKMHSSEKHPEPEDDDLGYEQESVFYTSPKFLGPIIITLVSILILLVFVAKIVLVIMYKRGERYRMSLLQAHKNTIVYQKLSEEIKPTTDSKNKFTHPKVHRYAPISSV